MLRILILCLITFGATAFAEESESVFDITEELGDDKNVDDSVFSTIDKNENTILPSAISEGYYSAAKIIALNKITANSKPIIIQKGKAAYFNNVKIELNKCWKSGKQIDPTNEMLITVTENKFDDDPKIIFHGWIISNQAAISTFEHPVYEILAVECVGSRLN